MTFTRPFGRGFLHDRSQREQTFDTGPGIGADGQWRSWPTGRYLAGQGDTTEELRVRGSRAVHDSPNLPDGDAWAPSASPP